MFKKKKEEQTQTSSPIKGKIISIACRNAEHIIGNKGAIPWNCPEDMKFFEKTTKGNTVVMGRRTYESIGHDLLSRKNVVLTRDPENMKKRYPESNAIFTSHMYFPESEDEVLFVIGGSSIYRLYAPYCPTIILSTIYVDGIEGDCFMAPFPVNYSMTHLGYKEVVVKYTDKEGVYKEKKVPYDIIRYDYAPVQPRTS